MNQNKDEEFYLIEYYHNNTFSIIGRKLYPRDIAERILSAYKELLYDKYYQEDWIYDDVKEFKLVTPEELKTMMGNVRRVIEDDYYDYTKGDGYKQEVYDHTLGRWTFDGENCKHYPIRRG
jgi:hypothetical protein